MNETPIPPIRVKLSVVGYILLSLLLGITSLRFLIPWWRGKKRTVFKNMIAFHLIVFIMSLETFIFALIHICILFKGQTYELLGMVTFLSLILTTNFVIAAARPYYIWLHLLEKQQFVPIFGVIEFILFIGTLLSGLIYTIIEHQNSDPHTWYNALSDSPSYETFLCLGGMTMGVTYIILGILVYKKLLKRKQYSDTSKTSDRSFPRNRRNRMRSWSKVSLDSLDSNPTELTSSLLDSDPSSESSTLQSLPPSSSSPTSSPTPVANTPSSVSHKSNKRIKSTARKILILSLLLSIPISLTGIFAGIQAISLYSNGTVEQVTSVAIIYGVVTNTSAPATIVLVSWLLSSSSTRS
eukprot:gb/GECH01007593.1/.p1 GENE.gb/GECH01007593.1/~~gb/GECH01007593.1/.p1  ORF type:complete len:353 (+),score=55.05 gb/GECH01007593.1/:1-1059(+)